MLCNLLAHSGNCTEIIYHRIFLISRFYDFIRLKTSICIEGKPLEVEINMYIESFGDVDVAKMVCIIQLITKSNQTEFALSRLIPGGCTRPHFGRGRAVEASKTYISVPYTNFWRKYARLYNNFPKMYT